MVSTLYGSYLRDLKLKNGEIFKNAQTRPIFELEKCSFFKWVRISPEIDLYHYQGASPAHMCIVWHQTLITALITQVLHQGPVSLSHMN